MPGVDLSSSWVEAKAALSMTDGESYAVQFHGAAGAIVLAVDVLGTSEPTSDGDALTYFPRSPRNADDYEFKARAGWTWWLKANGGPARVVSAQI